MNEKRLVKNADPFGYTVWIVDKPRGRFKVDDQSVLLEPGDLVLMPTETSRIDYGVYNFVKSAPSVFSQRRLFEQIREIRSAIREGTEDALSSTVLSSRILIADKVLGIQVMSLADLA